MPTWVERTPQQATIKDGRVQESEDRPARRKEQGTRGVREDPLGSFSSNVFLLWVALLSMTPPPATTVS